MQADSCMELFPTDVKDLQLKSDSRDHREDINKHSDGRDHKVEIDSDIFVKK